MTYGPPLSMPGGINAYIRPARSISRPKVIGPQRWEGIQLRNYLSNHRIYFHIIYNERSTLWLGFHSMANAETTLCGGQSAARTMPQLSSDLTTEKTTNPLTERFAQLVTRFVGWWGNSFSRRRVGTSVKAPKLWDDMSMMLKTPNSKDHVFLFFFFLLSPLYCLIER